MGCDIHGLVQVRFNKDASYFDDGPIEDSRNYLVFSMLAGVRDRYGVRAIDQPRGIPEDFEGDIYSLGDHSFSWLTISEILAWDGWDEKPDCLPNNTFREACAVFRAWLDWLALKHSTWLRDDPAAVRLVFGFDS